MLSRASVAAHSCRLLRPWPCSGLHSHLLQCSAGEAGSLQGMAALSDSLRFALLRSGLCRGLQTFLPDWCHFRGVLSPTVQGAARSRLQLTGPKASLAAAEPK